MVDQVSVFRDAIANVKYKSQIKFAYSEQSE